MTYKDNNTAKESKKIFCNHNMSMLLNKNSNMGSPLLHEFKRQASFFFKEKIKTARLALTDVTTAQLLTEEATNGDVWPPDTRIMGVISRDAFEVDEYWRIVDILRKRLLKFERKNWRASYKTLLVLEHLLTHGPLSIAEEFKSDKAVIEEIGRFQFVDEKGFNWGSSVRNLSQRILNLLGSETVLKEERAVARKLTRGIRGFGSFNQQSLMEDESLERINTTVRTWERCNSKYNDHENPENELLLSNDKLLTRERIPEAPEKLVDNRLGFKSPAGIGDLEERKVEAHPFVCRDHDTTATLLSASE